MLEKGYLIRCERGVQTAFEFLGNTLHFDATNPAAQQYVWSKAKKNYYDKGVHIFWLDEAEPEYNVYDFDNYRYYLGPNLKIGNLYPVKYAQGFYEGIQAAGQKNIVNLLRCAWAGSQKYGALVWSGDIASSFESMRNQLAAGLNMASPVFRGGQRTLAASTGEIRMMKHSVNCSFAGSSGGFLPSHAPAWRQGTETAAARNNGGCTCLSEHRMRYGAMGRASI